MYLMDYVRLDEGDHGNPGDRHLASIYAETGLLDSRAESIYRPYNNEDYAFARQPDGSQRLRHNNSLLFLLRQ